MTILRSIVLAFSCFSAIPMPRVAWDERGMRYMMAAFPLVGVVIGGAWVLWWHLCSHLGFGTLLRACGLTLIPLFVTGGIHMDGFADVIDAQSSHASLERKREILKDPHTGAFASMALCCYLMGWMALASELQPSHMPALALAPVISRCLSGFATLCLRGSKDTGMLAEERSSARAGAVLAVLACALVLAAASLLAYNLPGGLAMLAAAALTLVATRKLAYREFGGMSGDLAGFLLQTAELAMLASLILVGRVMPA